MLRFEDKYPSFSTSGYTITNEEPALFTSLLRGISFRRGAAIASAGEVPIGVLLPKCREELIAIDHSYQSLVTTFAKAAMLKTLGPKQFKDSLIGCDAPNQFVELLKPISAVLPEGLATKTVFGGSGFTVGPKSYDNLNTRKEWHFISDRNIAAAYRNIDKLRLVHGDLVQDLKDERPFDLLYVSNAFDHQGRTRENPNREAISKLVRFGGYILVASSALNDFPKLPEMQLVRNIKGFRTSWDHRLYRRVKVQPAAPAIVADAIPSVPGAILDGTSTASTSYIAGN